MSVVFEHVGVPVKNLERAKRFYCDLLGFQELICVETKDSPIYSRIAFLTNETVRIELLEAKGDVWSDAPSGRMRGVMHFAVDTDDIDREFQRWLDAGYEVKIPITFPNVPVPGEEDWWMCYFYGPDGESVEIRGPKGECK